MELVKMNFLLKDFDGVFGRLNPTPFVKPKRDLMNCLGFLVANNNRTIDLASSSLNWLYPNDAFLIRKILAENPNLQESEIVARLDVLSTPQHKLTLLAALAFGKKDGGWLLILPDYDSNFLVEDYKSFDELKARVIREYRF